MKRFGFILFVLLSCFLISNCSRTTEKRGSNEIKVGTIAGPETELMEVAKNVATQRFGLDITIVPFTDYVLPNQALADGSIDANMFQHTPYLEQTIATKGYNLTAIGKTFVFPMGLYSNKITNIKDLRDNAIVAVPNDPSNEARALILLQTAGIIQLRPGLNLKDTTPNDIVSNPKHIQIREIDAAQLPRVLADVDLAAINTNYAMVAGLLPSRDALFLEPKDSPYANIVVVRTADSQDPKFAKLMEALHSPEVLSKAQALFQGQALPAWLGDSKS